MKVLGGWFWKDSRSVIFIWFYGGYWMWGFWFWWMYFVSNSGCGFMEFRIYGIVVVRFCCGSGFCIVVDVGDCKVDFNFGSDYGSDYC